MLLPPLTPRGRVPPRPPAAISFPGINQGEGTVPWGSGGHPGTPAKLPLCEAALLSMRKAAVPGAVMDGACAAGPGILWLSGRVPGRKGALCVENLGELEQGAAPVLNPGPTTQSGVGGSSRRPLGPPPFFFFAMQLGG